ncbi:3910_t:CDS:1 [Gigaspora margarita]|uniref:3910_t:CDS:1 n=1 Tax=Gigaspora margarita TaxID=4874 RepID=A0ABN7UKH9_GIGMA|nr:3910_t:CDS:1 [Gigaspora margarita]
MGTVTEKIFMLAREVFKLIIESSGNKITDLVIREHGNFMARKGGDDDFFIVKYMLWNTYFDLDINAELWNNTFLFSLNYQYPKLKRLYLKPKEISSITFLNFSETKKLTELIIDGYLFQDEYQLIEIIKSADNLENVIISIGSKRYREFVNNLADHSRNLKELVIKYSGDKDPEVFGFADIKNLLLVSRSLRKLFLTIYPSIKTLKIVQPDNILYTTLKNGVFADIVSFEIQFFFYSNDVAKFFVNCDHIFKSIEFNFYRDLPKVYDAFVFYKIHKYKDGKTCYSVYRRLDEFEINRDHINNYPGFEYFHLKATFVIN